MKKLLTFLLLITAFTSSAQIYQNDPSYGRSIDRYQVLKALHIPTTSGVPNLSDDVITNTSAIAYDSAGHKFYVYDPSTETWGQVTGGGIVIDPGVDSITYHNNQLCQWVSGVSTCYFLNKFYDSTALNHDSTKILHFNSGNLVDSVLIPTGTIHIIQDGAGETNIVRVEDSTRLHFATLKNTDDITISKASDSAVLLNFTHPHYTKDQIDSIKATITADGITRAELIDTADNKVNKTDISGGAINQVLKKNSSTDYDWSWQDESGGSTIDTSGAFLVDADSVAPNTIRFYKGTGYKDFVFTGTDTSHLSNRIDANASSITTKFNISDTTGKWFSWGYKRNDSVFLCKNTTCIFIFKDSSGGGGASPTDTAFKEIATYKSLLNTVATDKGLKLSNYGVQGTSGENSPPLWWRGGQNGNPFYWAMWVEGGVSNGKMHLAFSLDSSTIASGTGYTYDKNGNFGAPGTGSFGNYVSSPQFSGTKMSLFASVGTGVIGANRTPNPNASLEYADSTKGLLINRVSNTQKLKIGTSVYAGTITSGGSGYAPNGSVSSAFTGGSGTGQGAVFTVSGGVITGVSSFSGNAGINYKVGDVLSASFGGGSGFSFTVTKLNGDTSNGLIVVDTTLNCLSVYNKSEGRWNNMPTSKTYTASGDGTSTTITVPHGLNNVTSSSLVWVNAKNAASASITYTTIDATNVYIHYTTAPTSGTNNLLYDIQIKKE